MDASRIDAVSKFFARRRLTRRQMLTQGGAVVAAGALAAAGLSAASAQEATPESVTPDAAHGPTMLFLQSFQSGSIAPKEGAEGRYTVTLERGLGQTIYFSDRPDRIVGATPTPQFLEGLGFPTDNPPNAALVVETASGETDLAVVELFSPVYDPVDSTVTYEVAVLANWQDSSDLGFTAAPADLAALEPSFGAAHLFIDDCPDYEIECSRDQCGFDVVGVIPSSEHDGWCYNWGVATCLPCQPWFSGAKGWDNTTAYWGDQCNKRFAAACDGKCKIYSVCRDRGV